MRLAYLWSIPIGLAWPLAQIIIFFIRFGRTPPEGLLSSWVFLPMGLVTGLILVALVLRSRHGWQKGLSIAGYILAVPFALIGSIGGGLILPPAIGALIFGGLPLLIGMGIGYLIGGFIGKQS